MKIPKAEYGWNFDNTYARLPEAFFARGNPTPVVAPQVTIFNRDLAAALGLNASALMGPKGAAFLSGNVIAPGAEPLAQAYAGHQFGNFTMLGDGRANLLGEQVTPQGQRYDVQLKGSGPTPFSRRGDGRAALGPMLREYIISEAMHSLGVPTTRSLAVVTTGENVFRETPQPGAVLTRVASSHIRVGTFEYAATLDDLEYLRTIANYTLGRHYPDLLSHAEPYLSLLNVVIDKQAALVAQWLHLGFIHGVMNTDNMALSGETIDYGPCAFMDTYSPSTVFSSIDRQGRYAFGHQPKMADWNLTRFAETLLPLLSTDPEQAVTKAQDAISNFSTLFQNHWLAGMRLKLGLVVSASEDTTLLQTLLELMERHQADYTNTFRALSLDSLPDTEFFREPKFLDWHQRWQSRQPNLNEMRSHNPTIIPRNHRVEEALTAAVEHSDTSVMERLLTALKSPYEDSAQSAEYATPPPTGGPRYETFCGT